MAFALTKFAAYGAKIESPSRKLGMQVVELHITALAADVDLDIGDTGGTFWTAAVANAVYGTLATEAKTILLTTIATGAVKQLTDVRCEKLLARLHVATLTGAGQYTLTITSHVPLIAFDAADGETALVVQLEFQLLDGQFPVVAELGQAA